jgi:hypothetical protein
MLISLEQEMPTVSLSGDTAVAPEVFTDLWRDLGKEGWCENGGFAVSRNVPSSAMKPMQMISTDSGPTIEIAPCPAESIHDLERETTALRTFIGKKLRERGVGLLGSGVHLRLGNSDEEYYRYRTQRPAYDYAIRERGWQHRTLLNIAAIQEVVDVPTMLAPLMLSVLHRLAGIFLFLFRNDPELTPDSSGLLSIRPKAWRDQVSATGKFASDASKVGIPPSEVSTWASYLHLLWESNPMFLVCTKTSGLVYVPDHPNFWTFVSQPPKGGWRAKQLDGQEVEPIVPSMTHVVESDWTYMGLARLRLFWKEGVDLRELVSAYQSGAPELDAFMSRNLVKVLLENRSSASPVPGTEMASVALVTGIIENLNDVIKYVSGQPYSFWASVAQMAESAPLTARIGTVRVDELASKIVSLAEIGLRRRGLGEQIYLEPLLERVRSGIAPAELMRARFQTGGEGAILEKLLYRFSS